MTRVPITSPLAVLTTRTTQEHIMTTHSTTDLKPGDIVQHPEKGIGLVHRRFARNDVGAVYADKDRDGITSYTNDLTGWERVETVRPGHVQVRVDDLTPGLSAGDGEAIRRLYLAWRKMPTQRVESTPPADEKPTSATVTLPCPDCGEAITREVRPVRVENSRTPKWSLEFLRSPGVVGERSHACQPDEPTEFGARVTVTLPDSTREKWCRLGKHHPAPWLGETYDVPGEAWSLLCGRGTVTIGWDE